MTEKKDKYPTPKRGQRVTCMACGGKGYVYVISRGISRTNKCKGCNGKGYFIA